MPDRKSLLRGDVLGGRNRAGRCVRVVTLERVRFTPAQTPILGLADNLPLTYVGPARRKWPRWLPLICRSQVVRRGL